jgi:glutamine synthetase
MLAAGLEGIKNNYKIPEPVEENIFEWDAKKERRQELKPCPIIFTKQLNI